MSSDGGDVVPKLSRPSDLVYGIVKRRIILNELTPETVLTELGLAHEIGCSQGPIREALLRLQEDGLVVRSGRRTIVTRLTAEEADEMLALRRRIETRGALKAALQADGQALDDLRGLLSAMMEAAADGDEYRVIEADKDFHLALFRLSGLDALGQILARCIMHSNRYKLWAPEHRRPLIETARRHDVLYERLAAGDGSGLAAALGSHIDTIVIQGRDEAAA
ncbi:GntR family transcriptional regulator [Bosea beijingensis]|uniref:GntR family transcriptional regulator n=1 Tax=Bosea beijingensis TaxID=3068632 RepID=UPI002741818B|nr:GntR family transcriptional regulator [Bosea sp. REN20]